MKQYIVALDQGTTSSRAIVFDRRLNIVSLAQHTFPQYYPQPGWVEHQPMEILVSQRVALTEAIQRAGISPTEIAAVGITNQRETTLLWDRVTGEPIAPAIVWQCRRTADLCARLAQEPGLAEQIRSATGLPIDAYFSATKILWLLEHVPGARARAERGELCFGTVDSWLIYNFSDKTLHVTDHTNASRTMLFNIHTRQWDAELCRRLGIPMAILPEVRHSGDDFGTIDISGVRVPILGVAGDQQSALFGQGCHSRGQAKNTYGTGCFLLMHTGETCIRSQNGLISTLAATRPGKISYALEGSVFTGGAVIQWLRDEMGLLHDAAESCTLAESVPDTGGVMLVPAFTGLGAPYWDQYARGTILGITRGTRPAHIVRAAEESIAYQSAELVRAMESDIGAPMTALRVDGGASRDRFLMQFQADVLGIPVLRPANQETTALGAAMLAGLTCGFWSNTEELAASQSDDCRFEPSMDAAERQERMRRWQRAVQRSLQWEEAAQ